MSSSLHAHLLGGFRVEVDGEVVQLSGSRTARSLLAFLLLTPDRQQLRSKLAGMYWPEQSESVARERLRSVLYRIGKSFEESGVHVLDQARESVGISTEVDVWVDATEFRRLATEARRSNDGVGDRLQQAIDLYGGEFMPGHYEDWVFEEQQTLHNAQAAALAQLLSLREADGQFDRALLIAKRIVALDRLDEGAHRDVMRLSALLRRPEEALRQYRDLRRTLKFELGAEPAPATSRLAADIASHVEASLPSPPTADRSQAPVFVARRAERDVLIGALERALGAEGAIALVEGPPGVGKSSLLEQAGEDAKWRNYEILRGSYQDRVGGEAFEGIRGALEAALTPLRIEQLRSVCEPMWLEEASRVIPRLGMSRTPSIGLAGEDSRWKVQESLVQVLKSLATIYPTMLVLEDVHWADLDSLAVMKRLSSGLAGVSLVVLLSYRREEAESGWDRWGLLQDIDRSAFTRRLVLSDLDVEAVTRLIEAIGGFGDHADALAQWLVEHTGGNPLFVVETLKSLREDDLSHPFELPAHLPVASSVAQIVEHRLDKLDDTARQVIDAAAVFARPMSTTQLTELTDLEYPAVLEAITRVVRRQVLSDQPDGLLFSHELIRRVAYNGIHPDRLLELHIRSAEVLIDLQAAPAEIAHHFYEATDWPEALGWSIRAAKDAEDLSAFDTAQTHYRRALDAGEHGDPTEMGLFGLLGSMEQVANVLGDRATQTDLIGRMAVLASTGDEQAETHLRRAWLLAHTDRFGEAEEAAIAGWDLAPSRIEDFGRVAAQIQIWSGRPEAAVATLRRVLAEQGESASGSTHLLLGTAYVEAAMHTQSESELRTALVRFRADGDRGGEARTIGILGTVIGEQRRLADAEDALREGQTIAREIGYRIADAECTVNLATILYQRNRPAAALVAYEEAEEAFRSIGQQRGVASAQSNRASLAWLVFGDAPTAVSAGRAAREYFASVGETARVASVDAVLAAYEATQAPDAARATFEQALSAVIQTPDGYRSKIVAIAYLYCLLEFDDFDAARPVFELLEDLDPSWADSPRERLLRAWWLKETGQIDQAISSLQKLVDSLDETVQTGTRVAWGVFLLAQDNASLADQAIERARTLMESDLEGLDTELAERARVGELFAKIARESGSRAVQRVTIAVPKVGAPGGRQLRPDELVDVVITLSQPADNTVASHVERRRVQLQRIMAEIEAAGAVPAIRHLAQATGFSRATIKRDLSALRADRHAIATRGS